MAPSHLRTLSEWIGMCLPQLQTLTNQPVLSLHLYFLVNARLLRLTPQAINLTPDVTNWLHRSPEKRVECLVTSIRNVPVCPSIVHAFPENIGLTEAYIRRAIDGLEQQRKEEPELVKPAHWLSSSDRERWILTIPDSLPDWLLFDLLQLGSYHPDTGLELTPLSIASLYASFYGFDQIRWLLEMALQNELEVERQKQLHCWLRKGKGYQLTGFLLTTDLPEQLAMLLQNRRLRTCILRQLGPRHALVVPESLPRLQRWLAKKGYPLAGYAEYKEQAVTVDTQYQWLGLQLLIQLQKKLRLPYPPPHEQLARLSQNFPPEILGHLQIMAQQINRDLEEIGQQQDAYFPALCSPSPQLLIGIQQAIALEKPVTIYYQVRGDVEPKRHQIEPLWLEQRDQLYYLHAYSYRAEAQLTFRLDRIQTLEEVSAR